MNNASMRKEVKFYCDKCEKEVTVETSVVNSDEEAIDWHKTIYHELVDSK